MAQERRSAAERLKEALAKAAEKHAKDTAKLAVEIKGIKREQSEPDIPQAIAVFCKVLRRNKLTAKKLRLLAQVLGTPITDGTRVYPPVSEEVSQQAEANLRISNAAVQALEYFAAAPPTADVLQACLPVQLISSASTSPPPKPGLPSSGSYCGRKRGDPAEHTRR